MNKAAAATAASTDGSRSSALVSSMTPLATDTSVEADVAVASPVRHDLRDHRDGDSNRAPQTPSPTQWREEPCIAPPAAVGAVDSLFRSHQIVPGIGVKMNAKEAKRLRRSEIEKRSRERRQGSVSTMRTELDRLERQYALLMSRDENATRGAIVRPTELPSLRARFLQLSSEATALREEDKSLREMLHEKQLFSDSIRSLLTQFSGDSTFARHAVSHATYELLAPERCFAYMRDAYDTIARFESDRNFVTSGSSVMGWTDKRRLDESAGKMHFAFTKRFGAHEDPERLMADSWEMFCDEKAMRRTIFTASVHVDLELLQAVSDDIFIMRRHTRYVAMQRSFHTVYLLFRMRTEHGYTICFRTIPCASVQQAMEDGDSWIEIFHWTHIRRVGACDHDHDQNSEHDAVEISFGGSLGGSVMKFAMHWMIELIMTVIRWENACVAPMFITAY